MSASARPPPGLFAERGKFVLHGGALVARAVGAALVCTLPAMVRVSAVLGGTAPGVRAWASLATAALGPMVLAIVVLRRARRELHTVAGSGTWLVGFGFALWLASLLVTLAVFGGVLRATTHHHALAGVTYAFGALALAAGWGLVCARLVAILRGASKRVRRWGIVLLGALALGAVAYLGVGFLGAVARDPSSAKASATVVDVLAFAVLAFFMSRRADAVRWSFALAGPPLAVFLATLGVTTLRDPPVREAIDERAGTFATAADFIAGK
jgi:hypothetical protein